MSNSSSQSFNEKVSLIYEFNKNSPLLFRVANTELEKNNPEVCIKIVQNGLRIFPENPLGYILLGRAYARIGEFEKAREKINYAGKLLGSPRTVEFYSIELDRIRKNFSSFESSRGEVFLNLKEDKESGDNSNVDNSKNELGNSKAIDKNLDKIAAEISAVKLSRSNDVVSKEQAVVNKISQEQMIVSETMAKILISQDQFSEAKKVYLKLKETNPSKESYYQEKIQEIDQRLNS
jgi:tetratricopeptide (TPR) repeat protein